MEVTLKEAAGLCKKSEKTLRRKIEAGLLEGRKEPLEFGGFMWMIDVESLDELYPGSRPNNLPQVYHAPEPPQVRLKNRQESEEKVEQEALVPRTVVSDSEEMEEGPDYSEDDGEEWNARQSFFDYILEENRSLKCDLKDKEARILALNERAFVLERALGEQEGTSSTQARVLEWFQSQESAREKARQEQEERLLTAGPQEAVKKPRVSPMVAALGSAAATIALMVILFASGVLV